MCLSTYIEKRPQLDTDCARSTGAAHCAHSTGVAPLLSPTPLRPRSEVLFWSAILWLKSDFSFPWFQKNGEMKCASVIQASYRSYRKQSFQTLDKELPPAELLSAKRKGVRTKSASRGQHVTVFVMYTDALGKIWRKQSRDRDRECGESSKDSAAILG